MLATGIRLLPLLRSKLTHFARVKFHDGDQRMKRFLFLMLAAGGLLFATASEANAGHWHGPYGYGYGFRGGGLSINIGRGYPRHVHRRWGYGYPVRRSFGVHYGYGPRVYSSGYYGGGYYGGYYGGGCRY